jgi:hypothetical protein
MAQNNSTTNRKKTEAELMAGSEIAQFLIQNELEEEREAKTAKEVVEGTRKDIGLSQDRSQKEFEEFMVSQLQYLDVLEKRESEEVTDTQSST